VRSAECGTTVIGPLSLVIWKGKKTGGKGGSGTRDPPKAGRPRDKGTAKMADGGQRPGIGIREPASGIRGSPLVARGSSLVAR